MNKKHIIITALITAVAVFVLTSAFYIATPSGRLLYSVASESSVGKSYAKFMEIEQLIDQHYMGETDKEKMMENAFSAYVATLGDPYTGYLDKTTYSDMQENLSGDYCGIGVEITSEADKICVTGVKENSPAQKAGLLVGDFIVKIDEVSYTGSQIDEASKAIKSGKEGTEVTLTVERGGEIMEIKVTREKISLEYVTSQMLDNSIGYVKIETFGNGTAKKFNETIDDLKEKGMKSLIIDVRSNPGGVLDEVVEMTDILIGEGVITTIKEKGKEDQIYKSDSDELDLPMCMLINEGSASASEVMAGALRDHKKAVLVGKRTFGKGVVQGIYEFTDSTAIRITVAKYYTPNGECIHQKGIEPDYDVELPENYFKGKFSKSHENDAQLEKAIEVLTLNPDGNNNTEEI